MSIFPSQVIDNFQPSNAYPFLKCAGGKTQLLSKINELLPLSFNRYFEPFIGGGAVFFSQIRRGIKFDAYLSDINNEIINAYIIVRDRPEEVIEVLKIYQEDYRKSPNEFYYKLRDDEEFSQSKDCVIRAARVICLNRTGFNGLYRENQEGKFNVPHGKYKNPTICNSDNLRKVSPSLRQSEAKINVGNYKDLILNKVRKHDFIYLDPPYSPASRTASFTSYTNGGFTNKDQEELANIFKQLDKQGCKTLLSNSDTPLIRELYSDYANYTIEIDALRCINSKGDRRSGHKELLIRNYPR